MLTPEPNKWKIRFFMAIAVIGVLSGVVLSQWKTDVGQRRVPEGRERDIPPSLRTGTAPVDTPDPRENTVYVTKTGKRFHRGSCGYLKSKISISRDDALLNGYTPCKICNP